MGKDDHVIMAVERAILFGKNDEDAFNGFRNISQVDYRSRILENYKWMRRGDIENDSSHKHPIPYAIVFNTDSKKVFVYQRAKVHDEERLAGKRSWGFGGHINKVDTDSSPDPIFEGMLRELKEEVDIKGSVNPRLIGYINDDSDSVGQVHFSVLYLIETNAKIVLPKDKEIALVEQKTLTELERICSDPNLEVENWSRIALEPLRILLYQKE